VAIGFAGVVALALMNRAGVIHPVRLGVGGLVVVTVLAGVWAGHRGLGRLLRQQMRWSLRRYGPLAPLPAAAEVGAGLALFATASGPTNAAPATVVKVLVFMSALIPVCLQIAELCGMVARRHRRAALRRAIRAGLTAGAAGGAS
jgi:hypothetical protein